MKKIHIVALLCCVALAACDPKVQNEGYIRDEAVKSQIVVGQTTKDQVRELLGTPSVQSTFGQDAWYYINERQQQWGFLAPHVVAQDTTRITFDQNGTVAKVENYSLKDGQEVAMNPRVTPTEGHTLGFLEQVLGNIGRFNAPSDQGNNVPGGRQPTGY